MQQSHKESQSRPDQEVSILYNSSGYFGIIDSSIVKEKLLHSFMQ